MESTDAHLVDEKEGRERCVMIPAVKGDSFAMESPKFGNTRVVDKDKPLSLYLVNSWLETKLTVGTKRRKKK